MKDWCTGMPEYWYQWSESLRWKKVYIGDLCKGHDDEEDERGGCDSTAFAIGLWENRIVGAGGIFVVASIVCWVRHPISMWRRL